MAVSSRWIHDNKKNIKIQVDPSSNTKCQVKVEKFVSIGKYINTTGQKQKSIRFLFYLVIFFCQPVKCIIHVRTVIGTIPLCGKIHLKHSSAEFQSIQQYWLQLDIASQGKRFKRKLKMPTCGGSEVTHVETRNWRLLFFGCSKETSFLQRLLRYS